MSRPYEAGKDSVRDEAGQVEGDPQQFVSLRVGRYVLVKTHLRVTDREEEVGGVERCVQILPQLRCHEHDSRDLVRGHEEYEIDHYRFEMNMCCQLSLEYLDVDEADYRVDENVQALSSRAERQYGYRNTKGCIEYICYFTVPVAKNSCRLA